MHDLNIQIKNVDKKCLFTMFLRMESKQEGAGLIILSFDTLVELASNDQFLNYFILPKLYVNTSKNNFIILAIKVQALD